MKIKLDQPITEIDGTTIVVDPQTKKEIFLKDVVIEALLIPQEKESNENKFKKYELYRRIRFEDVIDLLAEEIADIKKWIGINRPPLIMGQAWLMLEGVDPNPKPPPPPKPPGDDGP